MQIKSIEKKNIPANKTKTNNMTKIINLLTNTNRTTIKNNISNINLNGNLKMQAKGPQASSQQVQSQQGY